MSIGFRLKRASQRKIGIPQLHRLDETFLGGETIPFGPFFAYQVFGEGLIHTSTVYDGIVNARPDVLVIGSGIIGSSIAWRLAQRGLRVTIVDAGRFGNQASRAGAGMLVPGAEAEGDSTWARRSVESLRMYPEFVRELESESGLPIDYRVCGAIELEPQAKTPPPGVVSHRIPESEMRGLVPELNLEGVTEALYYPDEAIVDPRDILAALRVALRGVEILEDRGVTAVDAETGTVFFRNGELSSAGAIVVAAGAWTSALLPGLPESFPVKGHLIGYRLRPGSLGPILRQGHTYILQRGSGFTIAGSTTEHAGFDARVNPQTVTRLHHRARRFLPRLLRGSPDESWIGFRPGVAADEPQVYRYGDNRTFVAYGHYRNGILLAPITAQLVAGLVTSSSGTDSYAPADPPRSAPESASS